MPGWSLLFSNLAEMSDRNPLGAQLAAMTLLKFGAKGDNEVPNPTAKLNMLNYIRQNQANSKIHALLVSTYKMAAAKDTIIKDVYASWYFGKQTSM